MTKDQLPWQDQFVKVLNDRYYAVNKMTHLLDTLLIQFVSSSSEIKPSLSPSILLIITLESGIEINNNNY